MVKKKHVASSTFIIVVTLFVLFISLFPFIYMVLQSLAPSSEVDKGLIPSHFTLDNYTYLFTNGGSSANPLMWLRALGNSVMVAFPTAFISVAVGLSVGYVVTKLKFSGKKIIHNSLLFQMFFPVIILLVPRYMLMKDFANTYSGMILPLCISTWAIFMYINYFRTLPNEIFEAARIDGVGDFGMLYHIALPITKSITTIVFLSTFMTRWNELMWDMLISPKVEMQTLNVLISTQFRPMGNFPGPMYAASVLLTIPIILLFLAFSKNFKEGISFMLK